MTTSLGCPRVVGISGRSPHNPEREGDEVVENERVNDFNSPLHLATRVTEKNTRQVIHTLLSPKFGNLRGPPLHSIYSFHLSTNVHLRSNWSCSLASGNVNAALRPLSFSPSSTTLTSFFLSIVFMNFSLTD